MSVEQLADRYEVIAVDYGSSDASLTILQLYAADHTRLSVVSIRHSGSAAAPRNTGIEHARGRYVLFVDADDVIAPTTLADMTRVGDETGSDVILCRLANLGDGRRPLPTVMFTRNHFAADFVESSAYQTLGCWKMFRRSLVEQHRLRFETGCRIGEDLPFTRKAYPLGNHVSALSDRPYSFLRTRTDGTNTTLMGQSPEHNLTKNLTVIRIVEAHTDRGHRRRRPHAVGGLLDPHYNNLSVDVGATRDHPVLRDPNRLGRIVPQACGMAVVVEGLADDEMSLEVARASGRTPTVSPALASINPVTHLAEVPLRLRPGRYQFTLGSRPPPSLSRWPQADTPRRNHPPSRARAPARPVHAPRCARLGPPAPLVPGHDLKRQAAYQGGTSGRWCARRGGAARRRA